LFIQELQQPHHVPLCTCNLPGTSLLLVCCCAILVAHTFAIASHLALNGASTSSSSCTLNKSRSLRAAKGHHKDSFGCIALLYQLHP
jgi:hypothetical protein